MLPPSKVSADDYPSGPWGLARLCEDRMAELEEQRKACRTREERRPINQHLHTLRGLLRFAKSRAGYREPVDVGLSAAD